MNGTIGASLRNSPKRNVGANYRTPEPYAGTLSASSVSPSVRVGRPL